MILIFGGAFQGKRDYAMREFNLSDEDIMQIEHFPPETDIKSPKPELDFHSKAVSGFENFVLACLKAGESPENYINRHEEQLKNMIIISDDISQGLVPMDPLDREWREATGRCLVQLADKADTVIRIFCGIPEVIKQ